MSPRSWQERVQDVLDAIAEIEQFTQGMNVDAFRGDAKTVKAVQLNFILIGEAANQIPEHVQSAHAEVPWHLIRGMRNRLVHLYFNVDPQIVWETIQNNLAPLAAALTKLHEDAIDENDVDSA